MKCKIFTIISCLIIGSCTSYGEIGFTGGVSSYQLSDNSFKVFAKGNAFTSTEKMEMFVLLKSAELAKEHGFKSFDFINSESGYTTSTHTTTSPGTFQGTSFGNNYGGSYTGTYSGTYTAPTTQTHQYNKPSSNAIVTMYKNDKGLFKTDIILNNLSYIKESKTKSLIKAIVPNVDSAEKMKEK